MVQVTLNFLHRARGVQRPALHQPASSFRTNYAPNSGPRRAPSIQTRPGDRGPIC